MERAADAHTPGEVSSVWHSSTADVVGRRGGTGRSLWWSTADQGRNRERKQGENERIDDKGDSEEEENSTVEGVGNKCVEKNWKGREVWRCDKRDGSAGANEE